MGRHNNLKSRNRAMLGVFVPPVLVFLLIVAGLYIYNKRNDDSSSAYDRTISDCVRDHTRVSTATEDQATSDCVRDTTAGDSR